VSPGFIDVHAHSGLMILSEPEHHPKVRQGITTELIGVDGNSYAPFRNHKDFVRFVEINSGLDGNPPLPGKWATVEQYLRMFDRKVAVNIAYLVGNSPLRIDAVGWDDTPATKKDVANMKALVRESMEEGAFGMSTGLEYPPGNYADTDELVALSEQVAELGGIYHTHARYRLGDKYLDPFREAISGVQVGQKLEVVVEKVSDFGVFAVISEGVTGLIPNSHMNTPRGTNHSRSFKPGTKVDVQVIAIDMGKRKITLSRKALEEGGARSDWLDYKKKVKEQEAGGKSAMQLALEAAQFGND